MGYCFTLPQSDSGFSQHNPFQALGHAYRTRKAVTINLRLTVSQHPAEISSRLE